MDGGSQWACRALSTDLYSSSITSTSAEVRYSQSRSLLSFRQIEQHSCSSSTLPPWTSSPSQPLDVMVAGSPIDSPQRWQAQAP